MMTYSIASSNIGKQLDNKGKLHYHFSNIMEAKAFSTV